MQNNSQTAILKTILYSDIFHFPLTQEELWRFLIADKAVTHAAFVTALKHLPQNIVFHDGYYCLAGHEKLVQQRKRYSTEAAKKDKIAQAAASMLSYIPTIRFIGISGSAALGNVTARDDIDLFIVTRRKALFLTRLWILAILELKHVRRRRNEINAANKVCVNLLIDESNLQWPPHKRDVYVAHEIAQVKPLFERKGMYRAFLQSNKWITTFLPNAFQGEQDIVGTSWHRQYYTLAIISRILQLLPVNIFVTWWQKRYMQKHRTTEIVTNTYLAFHPYDYRAKTLRLLQQKYADFGLLTKI